MTRFIGQESIKQALAKPAVLDYMSNTVGNVFKKLVKAILHFSKASVAEQRARSLAIAAGSRQRDPTEPNVWFPSVVAVSRVLSDENMALLKVIREQRPQSMDALAKIVGKQAPNVSRSLHLMAQYGLVRLVKHGRTVTPEATSEHVSVNFA